MTTEEIKSLSIKDYLSSNSIHPVRVYGHYAMYRSPFRNEHTASFKVDFQSNLWYGQIDCYLDNDNGGRQTMEQLIQENFPIVDCSTLFAGFKDLNEFLCARNVQQKTSVIKQKQGIKR